MPRIIAGKARGTQLVAPAGLHTRPTSDRTKEALFSILTPRLPGARFLDLFAGSGQIGLEALSRGAEAAVFVEKERRALAAIFSNIERTHMEAGARVMTLDIATALRRLTSEYLAGNGRPFDIVFLDPPYAEAMTLLAKVARLLDPAALVSTTGDTDADTDSAARGQSLENHTMTDHGNHLEGRPARSANAGLLAPDGILVIEHDSHHPAPANVTFLQLTRSCKYGTAMLSFYQNRQKDG